MSKQAPVYEVKPFPLSRRVIGDSARAYRRRNTILGLVEVDVTEVEAAGAWAPARSIPPAFC